VVWEWSDRVVTAGKKGAAADIMTLAGDASNLLEAADVLYKAAWALIGLERYEFAEELLQAAVHATPGTYRRNVSLACPQPPADPRGGECRPACVKSTPPKRHVGALDGLQWTCGVTMDEGEVCRIEKEPVSASDSCSRSLRLLLGAPQNRRQLTLRRDQHPRSVHGSGLRPESERRE
jgi:hypothetical protein